MAPGRVAQWFRQGHLTRCRLHRCIIAPPSLVRITGEGRSSTQTIIRGVAKEGRSPPPQSSEKSFFQNVEIRVENCWEGGLSDSERRPVWEFIAKLSDYSHFQSKANKELLEKSFLFSINLMVS